MKTKVMYLMNVDWNWIKQRPHFFAEELSELSDIVVLYQYRYGRTGFQNRKDEKIKKCPIYVIPKLDRFIKFNWINKLIRKTYINKKIKQEKPNCLILTFPNQIDEIPKNYHGKVIYDCMDNHPAFLDNYDKKSILIDQEKRLVHRANHIFSSSSRLKREIVLRYGEEIDAKISILRNGFNGKILHIDEQNTNKNKNFKIGYFGTISTWFNFDYIIRSLEVYDNLEYILIGPLDGVQIPKHERIKYMGTVEHDSLYDSIKECDCLMMPFIVNEIIESVDPVKLYEYINFNKKILCVKYEEIERFSDFVYFYSDYISFLEKIEEIMKHEVNKYSMQERKEFLGANSWKQRVDEMNRFLK